MAEARLGAALRQIGRLFDEGTATGLADSQLLERFVARGDGLAFAALVERHGPMVLGVCRGVIGDAGEVEDAFQATFLVLIRKAATIRGRDAIGAWLHRVAYRIAVRSRIEKARRPDLMRQAGDAIEQLADRSPAPDDDRTAVLHEEVARLPEKYRRPIVLCYLEGMTHAQAASALGRGEATIRRHLSDARDLLRSRLTRRGLAPPAGLLLIDALARGSSAAIPRSWVNTIARTAAAMPSGEVVAEGLVSATAARLARAALSGLAAAQAKAIATASVLLVAAGMVGMHVIPAGAVTAGDDKSASPAPKSGSTMRPHVNAPIHRPDPKDRGDETVAVRGRVLDPDGRPRARARIDSYVIHNRHGDFPEAPVPPRATSDSDGRFELRIPAGGFLPAPSQQVFGKTTFAALAEGFGPAWKSLSTADEAKGLTLRLARDDVPIEGRIVDLEGRPIAGVAVSAVALEEFDGEDLSRWEANIAGAKDIVQFSQRQERRPGAWGQTLELVRLGRPIAATSGPDGRFRLTGIGRERIASLRIEGPTIEASYATVHARTRPGPTYRLALSPDEPAYGHVIYYGATFDYAAAPTRPIVGTVRDRATGKPLAGVSIRSDRFAGSIIHGRDFVRATTDAQGNYRLVGMPPGPGNRIVVIPPPGLPYLGTEADVDGTPGTQPARADFQLIRGVTIRGRVTDRITGRPVPASVDYFSFTDNPNYQAAPTIYSRGYDGMMAREDGSFELVGLPGHGLVTARALKDQYILGRGIEAIKARRNANGWYDTGPGACQPEFNHRIVEIDPAAGSESITCDLALDPGRSLPGRIEDPDGKPLSGVEANNLAPHTTSPNISILPSPEFTVRALEPAKPRPVFFRHEARKLGAILMVRGDEAGPLVVRLKPAATITGRLLDADGRPLTGIQIQGNHPDGSYGSAWTFSNFPRPTFEPSGAFRIEGITPGVEYHVMVIRGHRLLGYLAKNCSLKPGEARDFGDVVMNPEKSQ